MALLQLFEVLQHFYPPVLWRITRTFESLLAGRSRRRSLGPLDPLEYCLFSWNPLSIELTCFLL